MRVSSAQRLLGFVCLTLFLLVVLSVAPSLAAPSTYYAIDPGVGPPNPRPNSDAAAAAFDAAAGAMGNLGIATFEQAPIGDFSGPLTIATGVTVEMDMNLLRERAQKGMPIWGTCTGMILLAKDIVGSQQPRIGLMDISVLRNAFGRQVDSFETTLQVEGIDDPVHAF